MGDMKKDTGKPGKKKAYRVTNWREYDRALVSRGSVEVWMDAETVASWKADPTSGPKGGRPRIYSNAAILCAATFRRLFRLPLRATEGLVASLLLLAGSAAKAPDFSTMSRRLADLPVSLAKRKKEKTVIVVDSTGVKVCGEGEWKVRQHGVGKRRTWKKIHIAIGEDGEVRATEVTEGNVHDGDVAEKLVDKEDPETKISAFHGDGAYDQAKVYDMLARRSVPSMLIPPRKDAKIWFHGNRKGAPPHPRDENLRAIRKCGRKRWKILSGYHLRSLVENTMFRYKTVLGDRVASRCSRNQTTELALGCRILNVMFHLGMPESIPILA